MNSQISGSSSNANDEQKSHQQYQINNMFDKEKHINPHDIAGQNGLVTSQAVELERKKVQYRVANELYLRQHPELGIMMSIFLYRVLEEKPENLLTYAGNFFDQPDLESVIAIQQKHFQMNGMQ